ncbi:hypothetical protein SSX86_026946 [Deinandra increscens subsp. villosa]|uniref:DUF538 domain-containing protein n=1 Tax=Deinandra increscens subsp. villosa TaxID=3103831 RepID=A0AAP0GPN9_9ASTR
MLVDYTCNNQIITDHSTFNNRQIRSKYGAFRESTGDNLIPFPLNPSPAPHHTTPTSDSSTTMAAKTLLLLLLLTLLPTLISAALPHDPPTVYQILEKYGLPSGLLPDSVKSYSLSPDDGSFVVELQQPCYIQFDYLVYYDTKITGKLNVGSITDLDGIQVKRLLFWFNVDEIRVDLPSSDNIYFTVGILNKKLDIDQFETIHACTDNALSACAQSSSKPSITQLPVTFNEVEMLITE